MKRSKFAPGVRRRARRAWFKPALEQLESRRALAVQKFAVIGDYGSDNAGEEAVAELVDSWNPDGVFTVGDNNYGIGTFAAFDNAVGKYFHEYIGNYQGSFGAGSAVNRFFPSPGNHDYHSIESYRAYFDLPGPGFVSTSGTEHYYDVVLGNVHLFSLDSNLSAPSGPLSPAAQAAWLQDRLAQSTAEFQILEFHHPAFNSGSYGNTEAMQFPFREWGVDVVLAGHEHVYERLLVDGVYHFTNGVGGAELYDFPVDPLPESQFQFNDDFGAMLMTADAGELTLEFYSIENGGTLVDSVTLTRPSIAGRHVYYNNSIWDGNSSAANAADGGAIATDKSPLLPGGTATIANYTSFSKGITGIFVEVHNPAGAITAADFAFKTGNSNNTAAWSPLATAPTVTVRPGAGEEGSDRVSLTWPDETIEKTWLQVTMLATPATGLAAPDVFYFGNAVGEAGDTTANALVNATDEILARANPRNIANPAPIDFLYDYDRDRLVNATDQIIARANTTNIVTALRLIVPTAAAGLPVAAALANAALVAVAHAEQAIDAGELVIRRRRGAVGDLQRI